ncbi:MAG: BrnA antitoxin family protein [Tateyamaria sp.]|uniref:BrnA antitoxin family protein n=1 Tax=Tateyamaria sp. TaxID=1929288 RepID=UPI00329EB8E0
MSSSIRNSHTLDMMHELERLQTDLSTDWIDKSLPDDWTGLDYAEPIARHKTRVTLRMDTDMVRWFRKLGPGYQARINRVLRIYWTSLLAGHVKGYPDDNTIPRIHAEAQRVHDDIKARRRAKPSMNE